MKRSKSDEKQTTSSDIDLSAVRNMEAVEAKEPDFEERMTKQKSTSPERKVRESKFHFTESELVPLPSGGHLYKDITNDDEILSGKIRMTSMTAKEEEILSTTRFIRSGSSIRMVLDRCIISDIDAKDILLFDSNFLMFYLRKLSYGDEYRFDITCQNPICKRKFKYKLNISEIEYEELPEDVTEPIEVTLPVSKYTVKLVLPRLYHSEEIYSRNLGRKKSDNDSDKRLIDNLVVTTLDVLDDEGESISKLDWEEFYEALPTKDTSLLREKTRFDTGIDTLDNVVCPYCEEDYSGTIPLGTDFFRF